MRNCISTFLGLLWLLPAGSLCGQELEQFRLKNGEKPLQAKPLSWDFQAGLLSLELADGTTREIAATELHPSDMRLVEKLLTRQLQAGRRGESKPGAAASGEGNEPKGRVDRIHGVHWFDNQSEARKIAAGKDGLQDDKPLVWFRVLGNMTGFL